jgi:quercetin dioxygenase-like cupin family protein
MAKAGDELVNPVTGLRTVFRKTAQDTGGELLQVDWIGDPGWTTGPDHVHPLQVERFEVISGKLGLRVEGVEHALGEGEVIVAPAGSAHAAWNASSNDEVHALIDFRPALYVGGGFLLTVVVNVPLNEELARVGDTPAGELARVRAAYEGPWNFWNGVRTVFSFLAFVALVGACLLREDRR